MADDYWGNPLGGEYELRVTRRALEDLGAGGCFAGELDDIAASSPYADIVTKFVKMRTVNPSGTEAPLSRVHRNDIFKLDGRDGQRAVTWHDRENGVVWLLAFTPHHDFNVFVRRSSTPNTVGLGGVNQLMPSVDDYQDLADDRGIDWEVEQVEAGLNALVLDARKEVGKEP